MIEKWNIYKMKKYTLRDEVGYIFGYNNTWGVQVTDDKARAKVFTRSALDKFISKYTGAGYGFDITDCVIEEWESV